MKFARHAMLFAGLVAAVSIRAGGIGDYYSLQNIATPKGLDPQVGGLDFLPDGRLVACFHRGEVYTCLLYTSPSPRDKRQSRMPSSA